MHQRRWLELVKDYDFENLYHLGKANKVADALSPKTTASMIMIQVLPIPLQVELAKAEIKVVIVELFTHIWQPKLQSDVREGHDQEPTSKKMMKWAVEMGR